MAVIPTGDIFKTLTLDGVSSKDYSVYITGEAVFNSPARDVEMITIPGRNGSFALDKGRFENIEVTYPAGIAADTEAEFREAISDFRNFLASRNGYVRLEDDYNPNEYRLAVYKSGLDVTPAQLRAGEFDITFDCKPQRYLKSGEDAISVDSGDVVSNPTLFASSPMLEVEGYGNITIGNKTIQILDSDQEVGTYWASNVVQPLSQTEFEVDLLRKPVSTGDSVTINQRGGFYIYWAGVLSVIDGYTVSNVTATLDHASADGATWDLVGINVDNAPDVSIDTMSAFSFGTAKEISNIANVTVTGTSPSGSFTKTLKMYYSVKYDGAFTITVRYASDVVQFGEYGLRFTTMNAVKIDSTAAPYGDIIIDTDIGEAYSTIDAETYRVSQYVILGADLPTLAPGANTVTFDNTITDLQIVPRWWKI